jgi:hypothetical protein
MRNSPKQHLMTQNIPKLPNLVQKDRKQIEVDRNGPKQFETALKYLKLSEKACKGFRQF